MTRRNIILVSIIVVCGLGAVIVLYKGFFNKETPIPADQVQAPLAQMPAPASTTATPGSPAQIVGQTPPATTPRANNQILPYGTSLDFGPVKKYNSQAKLFAYPKVNPDSVGVSLQDLLKP
jgi:hypothetical protein